MRLLVFLLALIVFVASEHCPAVLEGAAEELKDLHRYDEVLDTACGRRNFTSSFWSTEFREHLMIHIAYKSNENASEPIEYEKFFHSLRERFQSSSSVMEARKYMKAASDPANNNYIDGDHTAFERFLHALEISLLKMENEEAREYISEIIDIHRNFLSPDNSMSFFRVVYQGFRLFYFYITHRLSVDAQVALAQTLKYKFGVVDTAEMKRDRIQTAMKALERTANSNERLDEFYAQLYLLAREKSTAWILFTKTKSSFEEFDQWVNDDWNTTGIAPLEVIPAVETLYLQHRTLKNPEARSFVDWILAVLTFVSSGREFADVDDVPEILAIATKAVMENESEHWSTCSSFDAQKCYDDLSMDAKAALTGTFPELAGYLTQHGFSGKKIGLVKQFERKQEKIDVVPALRPLRKEFSRTRPSKIEKFGESFRKI